MIQEVTIGTARARSGSRATGEIVVNRVVTGEAVSLPVIVVNGSADGPRLWINAGQHGSEVCGVAAAIDAANLIDPGKLRGAVIVTPVSNPLAFQSKVRLTPNDGGNLGESYPGSATGTITQQIAHHHFAAIRANADYLVDMHSSGVTQFSKSYSVLKLSGHPETEARAMGFLLSMGIHLNCSVNTLGETSEPVPLSGSLDLACMAAGIPAFMIELGNTSRIEPHVAEEGAAGLLKSLLHLGMLDGAALSFEGQIVTRRRFIVRCTCSGFVRQLHRPHDFVAKGHPITRITDLYGTTLEEVLAPSELYIVSLKEDGVATAGDRVAFGGSV